MEKKIKRPASVWIAQALLVLFALGLLSIPFLEVKAMVEESRYYRIPIELTSTTLVKSFLTSLGLVILLLVIPTIAFWGLHQRKHYGRYLVTLLLLLAWIFAVRALILLIRSIIVNEISYWTEFPGVFVIPVTTTVILLPLIANLILSKRVASFFSPEVEDSIVVPPPPPSIGV